MRADGLQATVNKLEIALTESRATTERIARQARADTKRHNAHNAEREQTLADLRDAEAASLLRIDDASNRLAVSADRMRELSTALVLAHEEEQRRIARELHDQIGQDLTALKIALNRGKNGSLDELRKTVHEAGLLTEEILQTVREICGTLRPQVLDDLGLLAGIQWHIQTFASRTGLDITFDIGASFDESHLSPIIKITVFRVIQEALTNVSRHANTNTASVILALRRGNVEFSIRDGGQGFDIGEKSDRPSTGLSSMRERLALVHGKFEIASSPGNGTLIRAEIPTPPSTGGAETLNRRNQYGKRTANQNRPRRRSSPRPQRAKIAADR